MNFQAPVKTFDWPLTVPLLMDSLHLRQTFFFFKSLAGLSSTCKFIFILVFDCLPKISVAF